MLRKWGMVALMLLATPILVFAQNTGKVQGVVTDAGTGDPIPGAQVVLLGTTMGAQTDVDGNYFILGVPVGEYDIQARFVGYQESTVAGLEISSGYTQEVNFALQEGVELEGITVEYERPLIQKDAIGVPKIVSGEQIVNLPVRGIADVAKIQAGVTSNEGENSINVRGGRSNEISYYIDGVKVSGGYDNAALPQSAVQEQEMVIGNISAAYGDAMSGIINITTKSGSPNFFGSFEGTTSEALDGFGYNLAALSIGGPVISDRVNFFFAGEYVDQKDDTPRAAGELRLDRNMLDFLDAHPQSFSGLDAAGNRVYIPVPAELAGGAHFPLDDHGVVVINESNQIVASDGTVIDVPEGVTAESINFDLVNTGGTIDASEFEVDKVKRGRESTNFSASSNISIELMQDVRLRIGGRYYWREGYGINTRSTVFAPYDETYNTTRGGVFHTTWTHYLSNSTFYQLQGSFTRNIGEGYDPRFGDPGNPGDGSLNELFNWGDLDDPDLWPVIRGYKSVSFTDVTYDNGTPGDDSDDYTVSSPTYNYRYRDGQFPGTEEVLGLVTPSGGTGPQGYSYSNNSELRFQATATTQIGLHQIEFGGEFEQNLNRNWSLGAAVLSQYYADGDPERLEGTGVTSLDQLTFNQFPSGSYQGYNFRGTKKVDSENLAGYITDDTLTFGDDAYNVAPRKPIYYGGYVQDKIEFRDIVLNLGIRVDVFDNNARREFDPYSRLPLERAGDVGLATGVIGDDFAVYYNGDNVEGFRDLEGRFYDVNGQQVEGGDIILTGAKPRQTSNVPTEESFVDYEPAVTVMPRIGVSFPVTDEALFFARYGVVSQRPSNNFTSLHGLANPTGMSANALEPERTTEYELGFRQRLGARSALTISGFFRQIEDLIQIDDRLLAYPTGATTFANTDFGTVKGMEFDYDLRRTGNIALNANYTLSFAQGTGSASNTTSTIAWIDETPPNFISPLDFDQRHKVNLSVDYRLGQGEGPMVGGIHLFENFGINVLATAGSGRPYTPQTEPFGVIESKAPIPKGGINSARMPWQNRIDLRVDRRFEVGGASLSAFLWVQNLLDVQNVQGVWRATGLPHDDGFLSTPAGASFLSSSGELSSVREELYRHRTRGLGAVGIPRLTRIGVRLDF